LNAPFESGRSSSEAQRREAADWFVIIHAEEEPNAETLQAWLRWLDQDEGNRLAFESVAEAWHSTPETAARAMPNESELQADAYEGDQSVADWLKDSARARAAPAGLRRVTRRTVGQRKWAWLAAAALAAVTTGVLGVLRYSALHGSQSDAFTTRSGEQIEITLADGSHVWLGPRTTLRVEFTAERRGLQLSGGEAFFSVRKDHSRPFVVHSASGDITAVGTAFNVRTVSDHVIVSVSEGVVSVAPVPGRAVSQPALVRVASGQQLTFAAREPAAALNIAPSAAPGERARWRDGVLVYRDEPLRDVVADVARYSSKPLEITDAAIGDLHYTGVVYKSAIDEWASALPESFPVNVVVESDREIISPR
jgi:transmembrane sensor